jgi:hypothetical protein
MLDVINKLPRRMGVMPNYPHEHPTMIGLVRLVSSHVPHWHLLLSIALSCAPPFHHITW